VDLPALLRPQFQSLNASPTPSSSPIPLASPEVVDTEYALNMQEQQAVVNCFRDEKICESYLESCANVPVDTSMPWYWKALTYIGAALAGAAIIK
jgi:hypothetical protein